MSNPPKKSMEEDQVKKSMEESKAEETSLQPNVEPPTNPPNNEDDFYIIENLQFDSTESDNDSSLGEDIVQSSTTSLNSTVTAFRDILGRRYHAFDDVNYWLPNDDEEINRLDLQHLVCRITLNGELYLAPIPKDLHRAIDIGTGTGKWAVEFAEAHPSCQVIGTDISPIQEIVIPENCSFVVDNFEEPWVFNEPFDYIHSRMLILGMKNWPEYFKRCYANLKPGGWVEAMDCGFPIPSANPNILPDQPFLLWGKLVAEAVTKMGKDPNPLPKFRQYLQDAGFINIHVQPIHWPVGPWAKGKREKLIGKIMIEDVKAVIGPAAMGMFTHFLDWTPEKVNEFIPTAVEDILGKTGRYYGDILIVYAQKPEAADLS